MKKLFFIVVGVIFLFVSCQSDLLESHDALIQASKSENAMKVTKEITFRTYSGEIVANQTTGEFLQTGGGTASHIGQYTFVNTSSIFDFFNEFEGVLTAANGDQIFYVATNIDCGSNPFPCIGEDAIFSYDITGGTGRFYEADGWIKYYGKFVQNGPFEGTGLGEIIY